METLAKRPGSYSGPGFRLPMRDGNPPDAQAVLKEVEGFRLPMRDGNFATKDAIKDIIKVLDHL